MSLFSFFSKRSSASREEGLRLRSELLKKLKRIKVVAKKAMVMGTEFPSSVVYKLCNGTICAMNADKKLFGGSEEKATKEMHRATNSARAVLDDVSYIYDKYNLAKLGKDEENRKGPPISNQDSISVGPFNAVAQLGAFSREKEKGRLREALEVVALLATIISTTVIASVTVIVNLGEISEFFRNLFSGE